MGRRGFTLIELLIVIAIISILTTIAIYGFNYMKTDAYNNTALYDLKNLIDDEFSYYAIHQKYVAFGVEDATERGIIRVGDFEHKYISDGVRAVSKVSSVGDYANFCTKHNLGDRIYGYQSETGLIYYKESSKGYKLQNGDCPDATENDDFSGWKVLSKK